MSDQHTCYWCGRTVDGLMPIPSILGGQEFVCQNCYDGWMSFSEPDDEEPDDEEPCQHVNMQTITFFDGSEMDQCLDCGALYDYRA